MWIQKPSLSLADKICLALGKSNGAAVLTADQQWADHPGVRLIR